MAWKLGRVRAFAITYGNMDNCVLRHLFCFLCQRNTHHSLALITSSEQRRNFPLSGRLLKTIFALGLVCHNSEPCCRIPQSGVRSRYFTCANGKSREWSGYVKGISLPPFTTVFFRFRFMLCMSRLHSNKLTKILKRPTCVGLHCWYVD